MTLPTDSKARKDIPLARGLLDYFPDALAAVAAVSKAGNDKHNPGQPLHWSREKSSDHADCILRHLIDRGKVDPEDGMLHDAKVAWRALAMLQLAIEAQMAGKGTQAIRWEYDSNGTLKLDRPISVSFLAGPKAPAPYEPLPLSDDEFWKAILPYRQNQYGWWMTCLSCGQQWTPAAAKQCRRCPNCGSEPGQPATDKA